jgi:hypothetical protein
LDLRVDPVPLRPLVFTLADGSQCTTIEPHNQLPIRMKGAQ